MPRSSARARRGLPHPHLHLPVELRARRVDGRGRGFVLGLADGLDATELDALFAPAEPELTIAHHVSELTQGACGIPLEQRGLSAVFGARPNASRFAELGLGDVVPRNLKGPGCDLEGRGGGGAGGGVVCCC